MGIRKIITVAKDNESLRKRSKLITEFDERLAILIDDLHDTLKKADGLGLAAPQVGILRRVAVAIDAESGKTYELINPVIVHSEGEIERDEGCLSVPDRFEKIKRPAKVRVKTYDRKGGAVEYEAEGMLARAFCHEIDHLDGKLFVDKLQKDSPL